MSPLLAKRLVDPAFCHHPQYVATYGPQVAEIAALAGYAPDPEQEMLLDLLFGIRPDGRAVAFEVCVVCCRQNLKTGLFKQAALGWLYLTDQRLVVWSAHEMNTTKEAHRDLATLITSTPALSKRLKPGPSNGIYYGNGDESIELRTGQRVRFKARTSGGGRGLTGDKVILDEGYALKREHMGSLLPTLSAVPDPQIVVGSSAGQERSEVLRSMRDRGRAGSSPRQVYVEWCAPPPETVCASGLDCDHKLGAVGCGMDDPEQWQHGNPAMGRRITEEYIADERQALPPEEFGRERMGWWDEPEELVEVFGPGRWGRCAVEPGPMPTEGVTVGLAVAINRQHSSIGAAAPSGDRLLLGAVKRGEGTHWLVPEAARIYRQRQALIVVDGHGPAADKVDDLKDAGIPQVQLDDDGMVPAGGGLLVANTGNVLDACASLFDRVTQKTVAHMNHQELDDAVKGADKRPVGDRWAWGRKTSLADVSMLEGVTLAAWACELTQTPDTEPFFLMGG